MLVLLAVTQFTAPAALGHWACINQSFRDAQSDRLHPPCRVGCDHGVPSGSLVQAVDTVACEEVEVVARGGARAVCEISHGHKHRIHFTVVDAFHFLVDLDVAPGLLQVEL